jgi:ankyrin repeat protein
MIFCFTAFTAINPDDQSNSEKDTLLHVAAADSDVIGWHIPLLLAHNASMEVKNTNSNTPLHVAVAEGYVYAARALLEAGANIEAIGKGGAKPLCMALEAGNNDMIDLLLERGADVHARCNGMPCALFFAIQKEYVDIVELLLESYAADDDIHRTDMAGLGVLHILANTSSDNIQGVMNVLMEHGANVDLEDYSGSTPLHEAARVGSSVMISWLLEYEATQHAQNRQGKTPLDLAQAKKDREVVEFLGGTLKKKGWFRRS